MAEIKLKKLHIYFYLITTQSNSGKTLGISVSDTEETATHLITSNFKNIISMTLEEVWDWNRFRAGTDISIWPLKYQENITGLFPESEFAEVCVFVQKIYSKVISTNFDTLKVDLNPN